MSSIASRPEHRESPSDVRIDRPGIGERTRSTSRARTVSPKRSLSASSRMSATRTKSPASNPRLASAGVPIRSPDVTRGGRGSNGTALRFTVMPMLSSRSSTCRPSSWDLRRSTRTRCTSVPPERTANPVRRPSGSASRRAMIHARPVAADVSAEMPGGLPAQRSCW